MLAKEHEVWGVDTDPKKVSDLASGQTPVSDASIREALLTTRRFGVSTSIDPSVKDFDFIIIATPTDYDSNGTSLDTSSVEEVVGQIVENGIRGTVIVKSTVPIGFTDRLRTKFPTTTIHVSPEFLREGSAFHDSRYPDRIVVSNEEAGGPAFGRMMQSAASVQSAPIVECTAREAEAIKLFSNAYLAMRVAFFNELDTFASTKGLRSKQLIEGVGLDPRIGSHYNNPSFGYGGYCLPKDSRQLRAEYSGVPHSLVDAIVSANDIRKKYISDAILSENPGVVGIYGLAAKTGANNPRFAAVLDVMDHLEAAGIEVVVFDPAGEPSTERSLTFISNFDDFVEKSDLILANRLSDELSGVADKVRTRDIFERD